MGCGRLTFRISRRKRLSRRTTSVPPGRCSMDAPARCIRARSDDFTTQHVEQRIRHLGQARSCARTPWNRRRWLAVPVSSSDHHRRASSSRRAHRLRDRRVGDVLRRSSIFSATPARRRSSRRWGTSFSWFGWYRRESFRLLIAFGRASGLGDDGSVRRGGARRTLRHEPVRPRAGARFDDAACLLAPFRGVLFAPKAHRTRVISSSTRRERKGRRGYIAAFGEKRPARREEGGGGRGS